MPLFKKYRSPKGKIWENKLTKRSYRLWRTGWIRLTRFRRLKSWKTFRKGDNHRKIPVLEWFLKLKTNQFQGSSLSVHNLRLSTLRTFEMSGSSSITMKVTFKVCKIKWGSSFNFTKLWFWRKSVLNQGVK